MRPKRAEQEVDLFADMQPVIRSSRAAANRLEPTLDAGIEPKLDPKLDTKLEMKLESRQEPKSEQKPEPAPARLDMSFRPADGDLAAAGWGDGDWGDEF